MGRAWVGCSVKRGLLKNKKEAITGCIYANKNNLRRKDNTEEKRKQQSL